MTIFVLFSPSVCLDDIYTGLDLLGESCSFGLPYLHFAFWLIMILVISHFGFQGGTFGSDCISSLSLINFYVLVICFNLQMLSFL